MTNCQLEILAAPEMHDAREVNTILTSSLHALFGDFDGEYHACQAVVTDAASQAPSTFIVECPKESMTAVRAALTMVTPPPYLIGTVYRETSNSLVFAEAHISIQGHDITANNKDTQVMCSIMEREVWDCFIPAAIREDIVIPQLRTDIASFDSDDSQLSMNKGKTPYQKALRKRMERKSKELGIQPEEQEVGFLSALLVEPEHNETDDINPPAIYFDMHKLPKAPTWSDKQVDDEWLPSPPSLAYDDYSISANGSQNSSQKS